MDFGSASSKSGRAFRRVEHFQRHEISAIVIVQDHPGLVLVALRHLGTLFQDDRQGVCLGIVGDFHGVFLRYFSILPVR